MAKFVFNLEPVFDYRKRLEEISKKEFAEALRRLEEEETKLNFLKELYRKSSSEIDSLKEKSSSPHEIALHTAHLLGIEKHIALQEKVLKNFRAQLEAKRAGFLEASKNKKVIEKMKEHAIEAYIDKMEKEEQKALDDLVTSRFKKVE